MAGKEAERVELLRKSKWEIVRRTFPEARIKSPAARIVKHWKRQVTLYGDDDVPAEEVRVRSGHRFDRRSVGGSRGGRL